MKITQRRDSRGVSHQGWHPLSFVILLDDGETGILSLNSRFYIIFILTARRNTICEEKNQFTQYFDYKKCQYCNVNTNTLCGKVYTVIALCIVLY